MEKIELKSQEDYIDILAGFVYTWSENRLYDYVNKYKLHLNNKKGFNIQELSELSYKFRQTQLKELSLAELKLLYENEINS